jgi:hypothetical protein
MYVHDLSRTVANEQRDEVIHGKLACRPNSKNKRDLDIAIDYSFRGSQQNLENVHTQYKMYVPAHCAILG